MKWSLFLKVIPGIDGAASQYVYSTLSSAAALLPDAIEVRPGRRLEAGRLRAGLSDEQVRELGEALILLPDDADEAALAEWLLQRQRYLTDKVYAVICTTLACNSACAYCFQKTVREAGQMSGEVAVATAEWLVRTLDAQRPTRLVVMFTGGEPLLNPGPIYIIAERLGEYAVRRGIAFTPDLVTNGTLGLAEPVARISRWGRPSVQVTLDGPRDVHDRRRPLTSGGSSYERIMRNLDLLPDSAKLAIRLNVDAQNLGALKQLVDELEARGLKDRAILSLSAVFETARCQHYRKNRLDGEAMDGLAQLTMQCFRRGFMIDIFSGPGPCVAQTEGGFAVSPEGDIYNCLHFLKFAQLKIGSVFSRQMTHAYPEVLTADPRDAECMQCNLMPRCLGGCRAGAWWTKGSIAARVCERERLNRGLDCELRLEYLTAAMRREPGPAGLAGPAGTTGPTGPADPASLAGLAGGRS